MEAEETVMPVRIFGIIERLGIVDNTRCWQKQFKSWSKVAIALGHYNEKLKYNINEHPVREPNNKNNKELS